MGVGARGALALPRDAPSVRIPGARGEHPRGERRGGGGRGRARGGRDAVMEGGGAGGILPQSAKWSPLPVGGGPAGRAAGRDTPPPLSPSPGPGRLRAPGGRGGEVRALPPAPRPAGAAAAAPPAAPPSCRAAGAGALREDGRAGRAVTANGEWAGIKWSQDDRRAAPPPPLPRARRGIRAGAGRAPPPRRASRSSAPTLCEKGSSTTTPVFGKGRGAFPLGQTLPVVSRSAGRVAEKRHLATGFVSCQVPVNFRERILVCLF